MSFNPVLILPCMLGGIVGIYLLLNLFGTLCGNIHGGNSGVDTDTCWYELSFFIYKIRK